MKRIFINAAACLSPQKTYEGFDILNHAEKISVINLRVAEPDFRQFINPVQIRRMSRFNKIGLSAARMCLNDSAEPVMPDAIITATGYGSIGETRQCILDLHHSNEQNVVPNQFMQTTPNSIAGLIALHLKCTNYNFTYVHRGSSFEAALQDAMLHIQEADTDVNILTGAADETTADSLLIYQRIGQYKTQPVVNTDLFNYTYPGALKGEGAAFFLLGNKAASNCYATLKAVKVFYKPASVSKLAEMVLSWLNQEGIVETDLIMTGRNGDALTDQWYSEVKTKLFPGVAEVCFKHLCGEYATSSSFAMWAAANILRSRNLPDVMKYKPEDPYPSNPRHILIYNHYFARNHTFLLLEKA